MQKLLKLEHVLKPTYSPVVFICAIFNVLNTVCTTSYGRPIE